MKIYGQGGTLRGFQWNYFGRKIGTRHHPRARFVFAKLLITSNTSEDGSNGFGQAEKFWATGGQLPTRITIALKCGLPKGLLFSRSNVSRHEMLLVAGAGLAPATSRL